MILNHNEIFGWSDFLEKEFKADYFYKLREYIADKRKIGTLIYPPKEQIFRALELTSLKNTKVVIIGQDPYHGENQAHGLAFSVNKGIKIPPSLRNIYKELKIDIEEFQIPPHGFLEKWAVQGVLMLNRILTVENAKPLSHAKIGWNIFTSNLIKELSINREGIIFLLWGNRAFELENLIDTKKHFILKAPHPSPLSAYRGFLGCKHFSKTNDILSNNGLDQIDWQI